jgi:hypothetical protein
MAVPNPELPKSQLPPLSNTAGSRPIPVSSSSAGPQISGGGNRPIPLRPKTGDEIPGAYEHDDDEEENDDLREILRNAPAWLVSTVFHMLLLIMLGLAAVHAATRAPTADIEVANATEELGTQLEDPTVLEGESSRLENVGEEQVITPRDLPPVDDPLAAPLEIGDLKLGAGGLATMTGPVTIEGAPIGMALKGRQIGSRNVLLGKYGGNATTEQSVEKALEWLAKQQKPDGLWSLSGPYKDGSPSENNAAATAMALLAFQGHGDTHRNGKYAKNVSRAWNTLLKTQHKDGLITGTMTERTQLLYTHAQCAIALCELYGMTNDSAYRGPAERAIEYAVAVQDPERGGWRYEPGRDSDTSATGWFVMALQSARMSRLKVPEASLKRASAYLDAAQLDDGRRYGYWLDTQSSAAVTAEGLLCRQYLGWKQDDPRLVDGVGALVTSSPIAYNNGLNQDVYYWYYATQAAHHMEGKIWDQWNKVMRQEVPAHQVKMGPEAGSWDPQGDKWGSFGGRLYVTCLSVYMLEVYYRHLPIYSGYKFVAGVGPTMDPDAKPGAAPEKPSPPEKTPPEKTPPGAPDKTAPQGGKSP